MNDLIAGLEIAAFFVAFLIVCLIICCLLQWVIKTPVHVEPPEIALHEPAQGGGGGNGPGQPEHQGAQNGNGGGNGPGEPEHQAANQDGNGGGPVQVVEDDPQQEADLGDGQGGGGDQHEDDGGHHQHLPLLLPDTDMLPGNAGNHEAPRTAKVKPIQETTPVLGTFAYDAAEDGKLNAKSALYSLSVGFLKLLAPKKPSEQQGVSSEPLLNAAA